MTTRPFHAAPTPARALPLLYFIVSYASLALAFAAAAFAPRSLAGFYYHPRLVGVVHLVTLGWITSAALGLMYMALPLLLRTPLPVRRGDYWALASFAIGLIGMVSHFWIEEFGGMAWSGLMVAVAIAHVGTRVVSRLLRSDTTSPIVLPVILAFANIGLAATAGVVLGFDKVHHFLPGYVVANVLAHAHLAALGWACMIAMALVYGVTLAGVHTVSRRSVHVTALLLQVAAIGLAVALMFGSRSAALFAALAAGALARFVRDVAQARCAHALTAAPDPDVGGWHVMQGCVYVAVAAPIGFALAWMNASALTLRLALLYGICGLVGFLTQCLMGVQMRLVPAAFDADPNRPCAIPAFVMWSMAVPLLAAGFFLDSAAIATVAGTAGCVATIAIAVQGAFVASPFRRGRLGRSSGRLSWKRDGHPRRGASRQLAVPPASR